MATITFVVWIASLVVFAIAALFPNRWNLVAVGLFLFDLWVGLQMTVETSDPIVF
jgi:hypothetical protein